MILVKPSATIESIAPNALEIIEQAGRTCYKSEDKITPDSAVKFIAMLIKRGHESALEHASMSVRFICDRGVSHEIVRHRLASYSQESTRYCNYSGGVTFVIPPWITGIEPGKHTSFCEFGKHTTNTWYNAMMYAEVVYKSLLSGWTPQQARSVLPNSLKTELVMTANFREWREVFHQRTSPAAHPQMQEIMIPLLHDVQKLIPVVFDDINPMLRKEELRK